MIDSHQALYTWEYNYEIIDYYLCNNSELYDCYSKRAEQKLIEYTETKGFDATGKL